MYIAKTRRRLLASFISALPGALGRMVRYSNPKSLGEGLKIGLSVPEADKERFIEFLHEI
jgi:hypothetical protein